MWVTCAPGAPPGPGLTVRQNVSQPAAALKSTRAKSAADTRRAPAIELEQVPTFGYGFRPVEQPHSTASAPSDSALTRSPVKL